MLDFIIDPEFRDKIPPLTDAEFEQLRENILADGEVYEPICVWNGTIVDGHNRWRIIQDHPEIPYKIKYMDFPDKWAAFDWMYKKQLGRRNLTDEQKTYLLGKLYEARKKTQGTNNQFVQAKNENRQNDAFQPKGKTSIIIAKEQGVGQKTVERAEHFAKGLDAVRDVSPEAADKILKGEAKTTKSAVAELKDATEEEVKQFADDVVADKPVRPKPKPKGYTKADREQKKLIDAVVSEMYSSELKPFTIEMLEGDIEVNGQNYIDMLRSTLTDRSTLLVGDNRARVAAKIDHIIEEIQKIRRLVS